MADPVVRIILRAQNEASRQIQGVSRELGALTRLSGGLASAFGGLGPIAAAATAGAAAVVTLGMRSVDSAQDLHRAAEAGKLSSEEYKRLRGEIESLGGELAIASRGWREFRTSLEQSAIGPARATLQLVNQLGKELNATSAHWTEYFAVLRAGVPPITALALAQKAWSEAMAVGPLGPTGAAGESTVENDPEIERRAEAVAARARAAAEARARDLREIQTLLGVGRQKALEYQEALRRLDEQLAGDKLREKLLNADPAADPNVFGPLPQHAADTIGRRGIPQRRMPAIDRPVDFDFDAVRRQNADLIATATKLNSDLYAVATAYKYVAEQSLTATAIIQGGFNAVGYGLQTGWSQVLANMTNDTQTFRGAVKTIFSAVGAEIREELARIIASRTFLTLLNFIPGLGVAGKAGATVIGAGTGVFSASLGRARSDARQLGGPPAGGNTFNFHMITARDALEQIQSVNGEFRRAGDRQRILRRAGQDD